MERKHNSDRSSEARVIQSGMGGAGGGDFDDVGEDGYPESPPTVDDIANRIPEDELDRRLHDALQQVSAEDVRNTPSQTQGDAGASPGLSAAALNPDDIGGHHRREAHNVTSDAARDSDAAGPWDGVDGVADRKTNQHTEP